METFKVCFPGSKRVDVTHNGFTIKTDQLKENNGDETAPEPIVLFLASIAACAGNYAKAFCDLRKISTDNMWLNLDAEFKESKKLMDQLKITLHVNQQFPEKYIKTVIKVIDGCAVKKQLHPDIPTATAIAYMQD